MSPNDALPPRNTTTALLHFNTPCYGSARMDAQFTVRGIRKGKHLGQWVALLCREHGDDSLDATIDVYYHTPAGEFERTEVTHCAGRP